MQPCCTVFNASVAAFKSFLRTAKSPEALAFVSAAFAAMVF